MLRDVCLTVVVVTVVCSCLTPIMKCLNGKLHGIDYFLCVEYLSLGMTLILLLLDHWLNTLITIPGNYFQSWQHHPQCCQYVLVKTLLFPVRSTPPSLGGASRFQERSPWHDYCPLTHWQQSRKGYQWKMLLIFWLSRLLRGEPIRLSRLCPSAATIYQLGWMEHWSDAEMKGTLGSWVHLRWGWR